MGKLGTRISVSRVEAAHRNNLVVQWSNEYQPALIQSRYPANYDMKFCYGLKRHLDTELLNANLLHDVGTAKGSSVKAGPPP